MAFENPTLTTTWYEHNRLYKLIMLADEIFRIQTTVQETEQEVKEAQEMLDYLYQKYRDQRSKLV